jgi:hypothetical protein
MPITQDDIDNLNSAIASGERVVILAGESVTYRSISDLIAARNDLRSELERQNAIAAGDPAGGRTGSRITKMYYAGRGFQ